MSAHIGKAASEAFSDYARDFYDGYRLLIREEGGHTQKWTARTGWTCTCAPDKAQDVLCRHVATVAAELPYDDIAVMVEQRYYATPKANRPDRRGAIQREQKRAERESA